jgi:sulfur-carrier protein
MPTITFTAALQRFLSAPSAEIEAATVGAALETMFRARPSLRSYLLDDQGALRRHVAIFVNGAPLRDRATLADPLGPNDQVYVFQALTGG